MSEEQCGETKGDGEPCDYEAKYADGKCGHHSIHTEKGRPTKFTDERAQLAIEAAREGKSVAGCERAAGVGEGTVGNWLEQGHTFKTEHGKLADFFRAFARARATGESECIRNARSEYGNPSFEKYMLSSSFDYKKTEQTELTGEDGGSIIINTETSDNGDE